MTSAIFRGFAAVVAIGFLTVACVDTGPSASDDNELIEVGHSSGGPTLVDENTRNASVLPGTPETDVVVGEQSFEIEPLSAEATAGGLGVPYPWCGFRAIYCYSSQCDHSTLENPDCECLEACLGSTCYWVASECHGDDA